jgi:hypothetical protein
LAAWKSTVTSMIALQRDTGSDQTEVTFAVITPDGQLDILRDGRFAVASVEQPVEVGQSSDGLQLHDGVTQPAGALEQQVLYGLAGFLEGV